MKLDQFLKLIGVVQTGGQAKMVIKSGKILVNGIVEKRRGRKLIDGDQIIFDNETYIVPHSDPLGRKLARSEN
jgi:ribosome-associated protein